MTAETGRLTAVQRRLLAATDLRPAAADVDNLWPDVIARLDDVACRVAAEEYEAMPPEAMRRADWLALCRERGV